MQLRWENKEYHINIPVDNNQVKLMCVIISNSMQLLIIVWLINPSQKNIWLYVFLT